MYFPKAALIALYFKLIPKTMPRLRMMLYVVTAFVLACALCTCFLDTFWCRYVPDNWSLEEGACSTFNSLLVLQIDWALNFSSDIASKSKTLIQQSSRRYLHTFSVFLLPFPLLRHLHLGRGQFYGLILTFALGIVTIAVNLGRFISIQTSDNWNGVFVWSMAEMAVAIIVVTLPALKTLIRRHRKNNTSSQSRSYSANQYAITASHRRSVYGRHGAIDETGSDVELNRVRKIDVIYKSKEVSVDSRPLDESDEGSHLSQSWTNNGYEFQAGKGDV